MSLARMLTRGTFVCVVFHGPQLVPQDDEHEGMPDEDEDEDEEDDDEMMTDEDDIIDEEILDDVDREDEDASEEAALGVQRLQVQGIGLGLPNHIRFICVRINRK